jgi:hypothetical protein
VLAMNKIPLVNLWIRARCADQTANGAMLTAAFNVFKVTLSHRIHAGHACLTVSNAQIPLPAITANKHTFLIGLSPNVSQLV